MGSSDQRIHFTCPHCHAGIRASSQQGRQPLVPNVADQFKCQRVFLYRDQSLMMLHWNHPEFQDRLWPSANLQPRIADG